MEGDSSDCCRWPQPAAACRRLVSGRDEWLLTFETVAAIVCRVHDANLFYRVEKKTGIEPVGLA